MFTHRYHVQFFDTDAMGVVHHSNYVRIMEVGRVAWMKELGLMRFHIPHGPQVLGVTHLNVEFLKPCLFDDEITICLEGRLNGAVFEIRYALWLERLKAFVCYGETDLVPLSAETLVPTRFPVEMRTTLRALPWSETWPPTQPPPRATNP